MSTNSEAAYTRIMKVYRDYGAALPIRDAAKLADLPLNMDVYAACRDNARRHNLVRLQRGIYIAREHVNKERTEQKLPEISKVTGVPKRKYTKRGIYVRTGIVSRPGLNKMGEAVALLKQALASEGRANKLLIEVALMKLDGQL